MAQPETEGGYEPEERSRFQKYYDHLADKLLNLDDGTDFGKCRKKLMNEATRNFVVDFGNEEAVGAFDLNEHDFSTLLSNYRPTTLETRWINIWAPEKQKELVQTIASHFQISARIQALMCDDPGATKQINPVSPKLTSDRASMDRMHEKLNNNLEVEDIEERLPDLSKIPGGMASDDLSSLKSISFSQIVNQIWHFFTVDYGQRYTCIGYNSVYAVSGDHFRNDAGLPDGKRVWSWLILCDDGTVISIQENPFPHPDQIPLEARLAALKVVRRNVGLIFSAISRQPGVTKGRNPLMTTHVRNQSTESGKATVNPGEAPSLLFYYLFDDWVTNYSLVIRKEPSYRTALESLRRDMMVSRPRVEVIHDLHQLGRQLSVLKRLYQSYELIGNRILSRQRLLSEANRRREAQMNTPVRSMGSNRFAHESQMRMESFQSLAYEDVYSANLGGVPLKHAASGRFERLVDRVRQYALTEIEECILEKEGLTFLVFNLIAVKDSQAVERLTRVTMLLGKATMLFLPVSLMTAYFSTEVEELQNYTSKTYWIAFAVVLLLSVVVLLCFGWASGNVQGQPIFRSMGRTFLASFRKTVRKKRNRHID